MTSTCPTFVSQSFAVRDAAHMAHLTSRSYAQHMALDEFYTSLTDLIDKYAEVYMGLEQEIPTYPRIKALDYDDPVELLEDYLALTRREMKGDMESQALLNILAEIEELTGQTIYKLKFLK